MPRSRKTYCFFVRVGDVAGNTSGPSAQKWTALPVYDHALAGGGWTRRSGKLGYYRGTYSSASKRGATLTLTGVKAKHLALLAVTCPGCGKVRVLQGKKVLEVSLDKAVEHRIISIGSFASVHSGTVKVKVVSSRKAVIIDGLGASRA